MDQTEGSTCLKCDYPRLGLAPGSPCPECGEPAPPESWLLVRGWSSPGNPWFGALFCFGLAAVVTVTVLVPALRTGFAGRFLNLGSLVPCGLLWLAGITGGWVAVRRIRATPRQGDVLWIVTHESVEVRVGGSRTHVPFGRISKCALSRALLGRWWQVELVPRFLSTGLGRRVGLWRRAPHAEGKALRDLINARIRGSRGA